MNFMPDNFDHIAQVVDVEGSLPTAPTLTLRLSAADLQRGGVISTADGTWRNLWIVETVSPGAGGRLHGTHPQTLRAHQRRLG